MKRIFFSLCLLCTLLLSSCSIWVCNSINAEYLALVEQDGRTYVATHYSRVFSVDLERQTFTQESDATELAALEDRDETAFKLSMFAGEYGYDVPQGYEGIVPHVLGCVSDGDGSVVDAFGYLNDGVLVGFVRIYEKMRGVYGNYSIEEIERSVIFSYDAQSDSFTARHTLDGALAVAAYGETVIYWRERKYYKYDLSTHSENYLTEDAAYDAGLTQYSRTTVYSNPELCIIHMTKGKSNRDIDYMYVYEWSSGEFFKLSEK